MGHPPASITSPQGEIIPARPVEPRRLSEPAMCDIMRGLEGWGMSDEQPRRKDIGYYVELSEGADWNWRRIGWGLFRSDQREFRRKCQMCGGPTIDFQFVYGKALSIKMEKNITRVPSVGTVIKAKWPVNVRKGAADWNAPVAALKQGECFEIKDTKPLPSGGQLQIWASGKKVDCP